MFDDEFVRRSPSPNAREQVATSFLMPMATVSSRAWPPDRASDVQTAMTVLGRRQLPPGGLRPLDLTQVDLRRAELLKSTKVAGYWNSA
jgi:hypothetical protein